MASTVQAAATSEFLDRVSEHASPEVADQEQVGVDWKLNWTVPTVEELLEQRKRLYTDDEKNLAWSETAHVVKSYSDELVQRWKEEIDTLLVFAGLFSAILTAFNVQSYLLLQPSSLDPTITALQTISAQLASFTTQGQFINSTVPGFDPTTAPAAPPLALWAIWLNIAWFSGLVLSLSAAVIGITVKQWIHEYQSGVSGTSRETTRLRQYRLNGLIKWRVGAIVAVLPILLQLALALFLAGLLILLWSLHPAVAGVASVLVGLLLLFSVVTTILPLFRHDCAYLSPQSLGVFFVWEQIKFIPRLGWSWCQSSYTTFLFWLSDRLEGRYEQWHGRVLDAAWVVRPNSPLTLPISWRGREQLTATALSTQLDANLLTQAYTTTMDPNRLNTAVACLSDLPPASVLDCFQVFYRQNSRRWGSRPVDSTDSWPHPSRPEVWAEAVFAAMNTSLTHSIRDIVGSIILPIWFYQCMWADNTASWSPGSMAVQEWLLCAISRDGLSETVERFEHQNYETTKVLLRGAIEGKYSLGKSVLVVAQAAQERLVRMSGLPTIDMYTYLYRTDILVLCSVQPDLADTDRAAIKRTAKWAVSLLPSLVRLEQPPPDMVLPFIHSLAAHGAGVVQQETVDTFERLLAALEREPPTNVDGDTPERREAFRDGLRCLVDTFVQWSTSEYESRRLANANIVQEPPFQPTPPLPLEPNTPASESDSLPSLGD